MVVTIDGYTLERIRDQRGDGSLREIVYHLIVEALMHKPTPQPGDQVPLDLPLKRAAR